MNSPSSVSLTPAEEGVQIRDAKFAKDEARSRESFLDYGHALLALRKEVGGNDTAFGKKLEKLNLKTDDKNIRADAQKLAFQVESGLKTREDALSLPARVVRALPGLTHGEYGLALKPRAPKKPKAPKQPDQFDQSPPLADTPENDDDDAPTIDQVEAEGEADEFANSDDGSQVGEQNLEALASSARKLADGGDDGGEEGEANSSAGGIRDVDDDNDPYQHIHRACHLLTTALTDSRTKQTISRIDLQARIMAVGSKAQSFDRVRLAVFQALDALERALQC